MSPVTILDSTHGREAAVEGMVYRSQNTDRHIGHGLGVRWRESGGGWQLPSSPSLKLQDKNMSDLPAPRLRREVKQRGHDD